LPPVPFGGKKLEGLLKGKVTVALLVSVTSDVPPAPPLLRLGLQ
jgi:hypothetical protein